MLFAAVWEKSTPSERSAECLQVTETHLDLREDCYLLTATIADPLEPACRPR